MLGRKEIITIGGRPGSGKSTTSKSVAHKLGFDHFSSGDLFRKIGQEQGADVLQANKLAETQTNIDGLVDQKLQEIWATEDKLVIDSRMAWNFMPGSLKVFLDLDLITAAARIIKNLDRKRAENEFIPDDPALYANQLQDRLNSEARRYKALYSVNPYDTRNYDLVVNTGTFDPVTATNVIVSGFQNWVS